MVGRSSFHIGPLEPVEHLQTLKGYCVWGVGLLIPSSENSVTAKFVENLFCIGWVNRGKRKAGMLQEGGK
jgi:hypothetical protein